MKDLQSMVGQWAKDKQTARRVVAFGSSNTELFWHSGGRHNWVDWLNINLRSSIGRHVSVINQGICGETGVDLLNRIERDVLFYQPDVAIVTIAGNDAGQGFTEEQYTANLSRICSILLQKGIQPVLQTYYCPLYHLGSDNYRNRFERFAQINRELADGLNLPLIDQYRCFEPFYRKQPEEYQKLMLDWLHVNYIGNWIMGQNASHIFGLPELQIPADIQPEITLMMEKMKSCYE